MKKILIAAALLASVPAFAWDNAPVVSFPGTNMSILDVCLKDANTLSTKGPVDIYGWVGNGRGAEHVVVGQEVLTTSINWTATVRTGPRGNDTMVVNGTYPLSGEYEYGTYAGRGRKIVEGTASFQVPACE